MNQSLSEYQPQILFSDLKIFVRWPSGHFQNAIVTEIDGRVDNNETETGSFGRDSSESIQKLGHGNAEIPENLFTYTPLRELHDLFI